MLSKSHLVSDVNYNRVQLDVLEKHFFDKFSYHLNNENGCDTNARRKVSMKLCQCSDI